MKATKGKADPEKVNEMKNGLMLEVSALTVKIYLYIF